MSAGGSVPRPEDFGLTTDFLDDEPVLFVDRRRGVLCAAALTILVAGAVAFTAWKTGSLSAALFLAPILFAAWLILLFPLVVGCVSLAGKLEELLRSVSNPEFRAWRRYRREVTACEAGKGVGQSLERQIWFLGSSAQQLRTRTAEILGAVNTVESLDRQAAGADLLIVDGRHRVVIRCEPGRSPVEANVVRELAMTRLELKADEAILVAPAGGTPALQRYLEKHPIRVLDACDLEALEQGFGNDLR